MALERSFGGSYFVLRNYMRLRFVLGISGFMERIEWGKSLICSFAVRFAACRQQFCYSAARTGQLLLGLRLGLSECS